MQSGNNHQVATILKRFKFKNGEINYPAVFNVPSEERLPALYRNDFMQATALVVGALTMAFERLNFKKKDGLGIVVNNLAEEILDTCEEDNLSLEDLVLFLQNMVRGRYGNIEDISVSKFMILFDKYRDERHNAIMTIRENDHLQYKSLGDGNRTTTNDPLAEHFATFGERISSLKDQIQYEKNIHLKDIDKF